MLNTKETLGGKLHPMKYKMVSFVTITDSTTTRYHNISQSFSKSVFQVREQHSICQLCQT